MSNQLLGQGYTAHVAVQQAGVEAERLGHDYFGTEHLLLGVLQCRSLVLHMLFVNHSLTYDKVNHQVIMLIGRNSRRGALRHPRTPALRAIFELARHEAEQLGHEYVEIEHYLLAIALQGKRSLEDESLSNAASMILMELGVDFDELYKGILAEIEQHPARRQPDLVNES